MEEQANTAENTNPEVVILHDSQRLLGRVPDVIEPDMPVMDALALDFARIADLERICEKLHKDACRYQWLREQDYFSVRNEDGPIKDTLLRFQIMRIFTVEELDAAVDAAIAKTTGK